MIAPQLFAAAAAVTRAPRGSIRSAAHATVVAERNLTAPVRGHVTGRLDSGASRPHVRIVRKVRGAVTLTFTAPERGRITGTAVTDRPRTDEEELSSMGEQEFSYPTRAHRSLRRTLRLPADPPGSHTVRVTFEAPDGRRSVFRTLKYRVR